MGIKGQDGRLEILLFSEANYVSQECLVTPVNPIEVADGQSSTAQYWSP
jgi:hypothetical protein